MVRVEQLTEASSNDEFIIRFRGKEWRLPQVSFNLESDVRKRFGQVSPDEVVEIRPPHSHEVMFLEIRELDLLLWE